MNAASEHHLHLSADQYAPRLTQPLHDHADLQISLVLRGQVSERVGHVEVIGRALSVVVKDPGVKHSNGFGERGAFMARLTLPRAEFASLVESADRALSWAWRDDVRVARPFLRLLSRREVHGARYDVHDADVVDLVAALTARECANRGAPPEWLARTVANIAERWRANLSVTDIAKQAGVHPVYLARCIRRWYGVSTAGLMRQARMVGAAESLCDGESTVSAVAYDTGFADEAHLNRTLRAALGMTPARYRTVVRKFAELGLPRSSPPPICMAG